MISAKWLFENHLTHLAKVRYLDAKIAVQTDIRSKLSNDDITAYALTHPPLAAMPHAKSNSSSTERMVLFYEDTIAPDCVEEKVDAISKLAKYQRYLYLYDSALTCLNDNEKWIVEKHCVQGVPLSVISTITDSPISNYSRTTLWRYKERALQKADSFLGSC